MNRNDFIVDAPRALALRTVTYVLPDNGCPVEVLSARVGITASAFVSTRVSTLEWWSQSGLLLASFQATAGVVALGSMLYSYGPWGAVSVGAGAGAAAETLLPANIWLDPGDFLLQYFRADDPADIQSSLVLRLRNRG